MASTSNPLMLPDNDKAKIFHPHSQVEEVFGSCSLARVDNSAHHLKSFYIVYDKGHYGTSGDARSHLVPPDPLSGSSETVCTDFVIKSAAGYDAYDPGIVLFEHPSYIGNSVQYHSSHVDIVHSFPTSDECSGVSSCIVTGGTWKLFGGKNMKPPLLKTVTTGCYPTVEEASEKVKSIERID